jgi:hypothetical protein
MKLVSFDIGIRNLAVCVLEGTSRTDMRITGWDVIDVIGEKNGHTRTSCFKCAKPAMWVQAGAGTQACSRHRPKSLTMTKTVLTKKTIPELQELGKTYGITGKTKKDLVASIWVELTKSGWAKFKGNARAPGGGVLDLVGDIVNALDKRAEWWGGSDLIIFENQLDRRMFAVQAMLHMYFACRGFRTKGVSAIHKLDNITTTTDATTTYRGRKKTGIVHCELLCPAANMAFFKSHKKKDDLSDSFLMAIWVLEHPTNFMRDS